MAKQRCGTCGGKGRVYSQWKMNNDGETCKTCNGSGQVEPPKRR